MENIIIKLAFIHCSDVVNSSAYISDFYVTLVKDDYAYLILDLAYLIHNPTPQLLVFTIEFQRF